MTPSRQTGRFLEGCAGYELYTLNLPTSWEYIYQNRDILLKVDQYGPVYAQAHPPADILLFRREGGQKFSNWIVWIQKEGQEPFTNFFRPQMNAEKFEREPEALCIRYLPHEASYTFIQDGMRISTSFEIPLHGTEIIMKLELSNLEKQPVSVRLTPHLVPYVNQAQLAPWDKNEWYLKTGYGNEENKAVFWTQLLSPGGDVSKRRTMVFMSDAQNLDSVDISLETFIGNGSIYCPAGSLRGQLRMAAFPATSYGDYRADNTIYTYPPVYAMNYTWTLQPGEKRTLTQVLKVPFPTLSGTIAPFSSMSDWFDASTCRTRKEEVRQHYEKLCQMVTVQTPDENFNTYVNNWLPMQVNWVASLDRGWPTGMRGTRDSAQDYAALLTTDPISCRKVLADMLECQRSDGWFPRQYAASGRTGKHDMRYYVDGGAFIVEFFWMYLARCGDSTILDERIPWLDQKDAATVLEHMETAVMYYIDEKALGEHGLCKIHEGDWLDAVNRAGIEDRGESVTVTMQAAMALDYMADVLEFYERDTEKIPLYRQMAIRLRENIRCHALNDKGYFNGVYTDGGEWILSSQDPDGVERPYGVVNWFAVISGTMEKEPLQMVYRVMDKLKSPYGMRLFYPAMGEHPLPHVGRIASGDVPPYMGENGNVYNHGSQGFLARALAAMGDGNALFDILNWLLPYREDRHPPEKTMTPPYAIVNCWQQLPIFDHRGMLCFLTGSVAMAVRGVYEWLMGIQPALDGLYLNPCLPSDWDEASISIPYRQSNLTVHIHRGKKSKLSVNGQDVMERRRPLFAYRKAFFIKNSVLCRENNRIDLTLEDTNDEHI